MTSIAGRANGVKTYIMVFAGCAWHYAVSNRAPNPFPAAQVVSRTGDFYLPVVDALSFEPLVKFMKAHRDLEAKELK